MRMNMLSKPLYPPVWWSDCCRREESNELRPGEDIILHFAGYDCEGNPLFSLKRCCARPPESAPCPKRYCR